MEEFKYLIPEESIDAIITNVEKLREIENHLRHVFSNHGYNEVLMPSFEYVDLYTKLDCGFTVDKMFQYINHEGKNVYRKETMHKGRSSEFFQGGVELMNKPGLQGDKEVMTMIQESLPGISLKNILLELGSAKFYNRLLELVGNQRNELEDILRLRDISEMKRFVSKNDFEESLNQLLLSLPTCFGNIDLLHQMMDKCQDSVLLGALQELKDLYESLDSKEGIIFDLGMVPTMKYYTGFMIKGYSDQSANPILSGGRYDDLLPRFNVDKTAVGFCFHMNHILKAIEKEGE